MDLNLTPYHQKGYWAVLLGASSGIGLAAARLLASRGMNLMIVHRDRRAQARELESVWNALRQDGVSVITFNRDAINSEEMTSMIGEFKNQLPEGNSVRLLLHAVSRGNLKPMLAGDTQLSLETADFQLTIDAMALSWYRWAKALHEAKLFCSDARLLGLTSEGSSRAWRGYGAVSAAKSTLESLCRQMALEFAPFGIRCNILQPGVTDTPSLRMIPGHEQMIKEAQERNPFKRLTTPNDVAGAVELLCRDESAWINGAVIPVDGGESIGS
jgi:enoyl-[acyl-carrier protein] reductase I